MIKSPHSESHTQFHHTMSPPVTYISLQIPYKLMDNFHQLIVYSFVTLEAICMFIMSLECSNYDIQKYSVVCMLYQTSLPALLRHVVLVLLSIGILFWSGIHEYCSYILAVSK